MVSVDYLVQPFEVFREVGRVLRPGGLFLVIFSNRMFPSKAVRIWREADEKERIIIVEDYFRYAGCFEPTKVFAWQGRPRPVDETYAGIETTSDPIYAVYAERSGGDSSRRVRPRPAIDWPSRWGLDEVRRRMERAHETMACPHCGDALRRWEAPTGPFAEWDSEHYYICFNDRCPFYVRGWDTMAKQGNLGFSYRLLYERKRDRFSSIPVTGPGSLRSSIADESS